MDFPIEVVFRDMEALPSTEQNVRERVESLGQTGERIVSARAVVERAHRRHVRGNPFKITIYLSVPGDDIVVSHEPQKAAAVKTKDTMERKRKSDEAHPEEKHFEVALRHALDRARRRLDEHVQKRRGRVKAPADQLVAPKEDGRVTEIFPDEGYGFIRTADEREVYFHENSVLGGRFRRLEIGSPVTFVEEAGEKGPQASTVEAARSNSGGERT